MSKRKMIRIDQRKCNGCGQCIPNCPEGALQIIDGKARLISELCCDGLGACIGHCPQGAIDIEEREAKEYNERKVMENIITQGENVIRAHLEHLQEHNQGQYLQEALDFLRQKKIKIPFKQTPQNIEHSHPHAFSACPGSKVMDFSKSQRAGATSKPAGGEVSQLSQWPIQITLVPPQAGYLKNADLLIAADCTAFAYANFHQHLLKDKVLLVGCPKLDNSKFYQEKITQILKANNIESITCVHMEVPCCFGLMQIVKEALKLSGQDISLEEVTIDIRGKVK